MTKPQPTRQQQESNDSAARDPSARRERSARINQVMVSVLLLALLTGTWFGYQYLVAALAPPGGPQSMPVTVTVATARQESWSRRLTAIGTLEAPQGVDVTNTLPGKVDSIAFQSGDRVEQGDVLVRQDTSTERAELRSIETRIKQARRELERSKPLVEQNAISDEEYEQRATTLKNLQAQAATQQAIIDKKTIEAPFSGVLGIRQIDRGSFLNPGTPIVTLQQLDPIFVNFTLPEQQTSLVETGQEVLMTVSAYPDTTFQAKVNALNPLIDEATRSYRVQATVPNSDLKLRPGMFADVTISLPETRTVVTVPETAISFNAYGESVYLIRGEKTPDSSSSPESAGEQTGQSPSGQLTARQVFVTTGERRGLRIEVIEGVAAGDRVVTAGQMKLEDGSAVQISDEDPTQQASPRPVEP